jgi:hypothetical protein
MNELLKKLAKGGQITDKDLADALHDVCDNVHASCGDECPVYEANGGEAPMNNRHQKAFRGCDCFKDGKAMLAFLRRAS